MAQNFIGCDRDQSFLLPPDVRDWLPDGHLAWFVLDAVAGMDLSEFYGAYRRDGVGRRAYDPAMVVALLLYGYSRGVRSARAIERACVEDVAFKMIAMMETPDHATVARFVARHEAALAGLFGQILRLCNEAGLVRPGVVAIDGTRMAGNASRESTRDFEAIAREILAEAKATDEAEDELYGEARGDELPEQLRTRAGRAEFFRQARERRAAGRPEDLQVEPEPEPPSGEEAGFEFDTERIVARTQGRQGWSREAHRQLERRRWEQPDPVPRAREDRLLLAGERLEAERDAHLEANRAYEDYRQNGRDKQGRRLGRPPKPWVAPDVPEGVVSVSDPDTQRMKANHGYVQGYNAQAVVDEGQIVIAAEITNTPADFSNLNPMIGAAIGELEQAGVAERPELALADAGYWNEQHMDEVIANKHIQVLIPPDSAGRAEPRPGWTGGRYSWMRTVLGSHGKLLYRRRIQIIEPVFAHTKHNRTITRFHRRGRKAVRTEWRLLMATHNLTKLHRHQLTAAAA
ncbi:MAG TPA: transposase [Solirubrobacteraceae bacterium]|nr:transposase [Solirubrobacteraceae bacterium]